ncbi:hypothetical protein [Streptomyces sp. JJ36]|uniref:DUF6928 family protein n=1 Tax=Streptomyces sp. JJ36 TaxID=2736645 RepID=UPI001F3FE629|nr:hypothetical protein [Streptomyces sp. JJ36]MCF6522104.1 hypothetical protein [Streptomyces sp. JJ36]
MGARSGLLIYTDGEEAPGLLRQVGTADPRRTSALVRRLHPGWEIAPGEGSELSEVYPPPGRVRAASWPGVDVVSDRGVMAGPPSQLPQRYVEASADRRLVLHAMHSVVDWLAFAVWEDGRLIRSLSLSPDDGIEENVGVPLRFELPYWAGEYPVDVMPWPDEEAPYPLPFHPLDMGEDALRALCGFTLEGLPAPGDVAADDIELYGFDVREPGRCRPAEQPAERSTARQDAGVTRDGDGGD